MYAAFKEKIEMLSWDFPNSAPCDQNGVYLLGQLELTQFLRAVCTKMMFF